MLVVSRLIQITDYIEETGTSPTYVTELSLYQDFILVKTKIYDYIINIFKTTIKNNFLSSTENQLFMLDKELNMLLLGDFYFYFKKEEKYLICDASPPYQLMLVDDDFNVITNVDKGAGANTHYHTVLPKYYLYNTPKTIDKWQSIDDMTYISTFSITTGKELWSYDISKRFPEKFKDLQGREHEVKVSRFMGDEPDKIWLLLWNGAVLVLEGQTGKELALIGRPLSNEFNVSFEESVKYQIGGAGYLDERNKKVISLIDCYYHEINTVTYELTFLDLREEFEKHSVSSIGTLSFDDDYIYFYNKKFMGSNKCCKIGILNRKTFKIDWSYDFATQEGSFPMSLEVYNNKIFVVDGSQRLYIFERENE